MAEVINFDRGIDTQQQWNFGSGAVGTVDDQCSVLQRLDVVQSQQVKGFVAAQSQRSGTVIACELEWQNCHADQIGTVNPLERTGDDSLDAQKLGAFRRPVSRRTGTVFFTTDDDGRDVVLLITHGGIED